jgi:serine O-acetyltransferase
MSKQQASRLYKLLTTTTIQRVYSTMTIINEKCNTNPRQEQQQQESNNNSNVGDEFYFRLKGEAEDVMMSEPEMGRLLKQTVLAPHVHSFEDAVAQSLCHRLLLPSVHSIPNISQDDDDICPMSPVAFRKLVRQCMDSPLTEHGWTMAEAIRSDAKAVVERDPAMDTLLEVVLFAKGYSALVAHRVAFRLWHMKRKFASLFLQSQTSAVFGVDIHPLSRIGKGVMMDHATAIVVGETGKEIIRN